MLGACGGVSGEPPPLVPSGASSAGSGPDPDSPCLSYVISSSTMSASTTIMNTNSGKPISPHANAPSRACTTAALISRTRPR